MTGKDLGKKGFEWTIRPELVDAIREFLLDKLIGEYRERIISEGLDNKYSDELYKWKLLAESKGKSDLEVISRMVGMNLISWRAAATLKKLLETNPDDVVNVFSIMKAPGRSFADRFTEYKAATEKLVPEDGHNSINNDRTAALFLACLDPINNSIYKYELYKLLCDYLGYKAKSGAENYEHYISIVQAVIEKENADSELTAKLHHETDQYFWSDLLNAQDVLWQMQSFMEKSIKAKSAEQFTWIPFYKELAQKLLPYKDNRESLLEFIYDSIPENYRAYFHDIDNEPNTDVDPYTVFAVFNRNVSDKQRIETCAIFKDRFKIEASLPKDFKGIPVWNNMHSQLFGFRDKRQETDIDHIWELFEKTLSDERWEDSFNVVEDQYMAGVAMVTSGMFWTRPEDFIPLDKNTVAHLKEYGIDVPISNTRIDATSYASICEQLKELIASGATLEKTFAEFSHIAGGFEIGINDNVMTNSYYDTIVSALKTKKNIILQGAPGTGKTYAIPEIVTRLCGESIDYTDREKVMEAYNKLSEKGRVVFTTFHQSMDYEDFIEGLKPVTDENGNILYSVESGIFKKLCINAAKPIIHDNQIEVGEDPTIWKVSLEGTGDNPTRRDCLKNGYIRVGFDEAGPLLEGETPTGSGRIILDALINKMAIGDIVMSCYSSKTVDAIGVVTGEYEWREEFSHYKRVRKVNWLVKGINENIVDINGGKAMTLSTVYRLNNIGISNVLAILKKYNAGGNTTSEENTQPYVLVIDEINRGNISKIFGELITLIEPEKRDGGEMKIQVTLPYSKEKFLVPSNVYIIGTMNTADRSLTQFDYAMRRRFRFITMTYGLIPINKNESICFDEGLFEKVTNLFIDNFEEYLDDNNVLLRRATGFSPEFNPADMWIGQSYFIYNPNNPEGIKDNILYEIIPTLQQYIDDGVFTDKGKVEEVITDLKKIALG